MNRLRCRIKMFSPFKRTKRQPPVGVQTTPTEIRLEMCLRTFSANALFETNAMGSTAVCDKTVTGPPKNRRFDSRPNALKSISRMTRGERERRRRREYRSPVSSTTINAVYNVNRCRPAATLRLSKIRVKTSNMRFGKRAVSVALTVFRD